MLRTTLESEITSRGESTAEFMATANGQLLLERAHTKIRYNLNALSSDAFIENAMVADHEGNVIASLDESRIGKALPSYLTQTDQRTWLDPELNAYHFRAPVRYGNTDLGTLVLTLSRQPIEMAQARVTRWALMLVGAISTVILIIGLLIVRRELQPLALMGHALNKIAGGDFTTRVDIKRNDEIGELGRGFNTMVRRSELFFHYVDKMVIERLIADESLARPGGRERDLAVVFGDMRGYTAMSNRRSANEVVKIVNTYFHLFIECIAHFRGMVDKTMGDAIMAIFEGGEGDEARKHRELGVRTLAYMKAASRVLNLFLQTNPQVAQRCGLEAREWGFAMATGPAIVGNIGSRRRMDYTVCGRVVNLASRLEGLTKSGEVIIDNYSRLQVSHLVELESLPPVQPKGFSAAEKVVPHRLTNLSPDTAQRMRAFLKTLFSYAFVQDKLMPDDLPEREQHNWCATHQKKLEKIALNTPVEYFFARADIQTGALLLPQEPTPGLNPAGPNPTGPAPAGPDAAAPAAAQPPAPSRSGAKAASKAKVPSKVATESG